MLLIVYKGSLLVLFTQLSPPVQIDRRASTTRSRPLTELLPGLYTLPPVSPPYNPIFLLLFSSHRFSTDGLNALPGLLPPHLITQFSFVSFLFFWFSAGFPWYNSPLTVVTFSHCKGDSKLWNPICCGLATVADWNICPPVCFVCQPRIVGQKSCPRKKICDLSPFF